MKNDKNTFLIIKVIFVILFLLSFNTFGCSKTNTKVISTDEKEIKKEPHPVEKVVQDEAVFYKCDLQRTGTFKGENPKLKGEVLWELEMKEEFSEKRDIERRPSPIIFEDILYIGNIDYNMYAIDANTGKLKWSFKTGGPITSAAALWNRTLYFGSEDGVFYAVNIDTQKLKWKYKTNGPIYSSPVIAEQIVFFGSTNGTFYALDALTGEEKWKFDTKQSISCNPAIYDNKIYFVSNPEKSFEDYFGRIEERAGSSKEDNLPKIFALDLITGAKTWCLEADKGYLYLGNFCIRGNYMYVGFCSLLLAPRTYCQGIAAVGTSPPEAAFVDFFPSLSSHPKVDPSCSGDTLCFSSDNVYAINIGNTRMIGKRYQDYIVNGEYMWVYKVKKHSRGETGRDQVNTSPAFNSDGSIVYFGDDNGYLHAVEIDTGKEILDYTPSKSLYGDYINFFPGFRSIMSFPVLYKGKIYIYACEEYSRPFGTGGSIRNSKQIGVLYCIQ